MAGTWLMPQILHIVLHMPQTTRTNDPSKMTPREPLNHAYAMVTSNMVVRRLLSLPNWEPAERKLTKGGRLLILRGVQFGPGLFPEIVIPRNHTGPLVNSATWQEVPFQTIGPFWAIDTIFPGLPGDLELFTAEEVAKLKELGILNPPNMPGHLPLFPPLVSSSQGKVVSAALGTPPPRSWCTWYWAVLGDWSRWGIRPLWQLLGPSLQHHWQQHHVGEANSSEREQHSSEREQKPQTTEHKDRDGYKSSDKDHDRNHDREHDRSKKSDNRHGSDLPADALHDAKTMMVSAAVMASMRDRVGMRVHLTAAKQSRDVEWAPVHRAAARSRTLPSVDLCHLCPCSIQHP